MKNIPLASSGLKRILVADNDQFLAESLIQALADEGFEVHWTRDIASTLHLSATHHFDAILLALKFPDGNGLTLLEKLRLSLDLVPVIMVTAQQEVQERMRGLDLGADSYLIKPFDVVGIAAEVTQFIERSANRHPHQLHYRDLSLDLMNHQAELREFHTQLSIWETPVLARLMRKPGAVHSKEVLDRALVPEIPGFNRPNIEAVVRSINYKLGLHLIECGGDKGWYLTLKP